MTVTDLIACLKETPPEAVVLIFLANGDASLIDELGQLYVPESEWTCERRYHVDGKSTDYHHPYTGRTFGFNVERDETWQERVVILAPAEENLELIFPKKYDDEDATPLGDNLREAAMRARRAMVERGEFLPETEIRARLGISKKRFGRMLEDGSIFSLDVDGTAYFPTLLAAPRLYRKRLQAICRIIAPAPAGSRLDFLSTPHGALGDKSLLEMLDDDGDYKRLCEMAEAWAAQYSRTSVTLYEGEHETEPSGLAPLYTAIAAVDPRKPLWIRASKVLHEHGYEWPLGPYPEYRTHTLFVARQSAGYTQPVSEACVQILAKDDFIRVRVLYESGKARESETMSVAKGNSVVDVAKKVVARLRRR